MNPWNTAVVRSAESLAALLAEPSAVADLDVAVTGRGAVLNHVSTVLADIAPRTRTRHAMPRDYAVPVALVEFDPLDALGRILHGRVHPQLDRPPSELLDIRKPVDAITARWVDAGRYALLATRAWNGPSMGALDGDRAWHVVAEVAALAEAIAILDRALAPMAADRPDISAIIQSTAGLRIAARETLTLTDAGTQSGSEPKPAAGPYAAEIKDALAARSPRQPKISNDVRRLTVLLSEAPELTPHHVRACARVGRDLAVLAARDAVSFNGADLRDELGRIARGMHTVVRRDRGEFAINPVESRRFELGLRELHSTTQLAFAMRTSLGSDEATRVARRLPDLVEILNERTIAQINNSRWAMPDRRENAELPYALASRTDAVHRTPMLDGLVAASRSADVLRAKVAPPMNPSGLASVLAVLPRRLELARPDHPARHGVCSSSGPVVPGR